VPVDSDSPIRNLLKVQTVRCALVLHEGNQSAPRAPLSLFHITYITDLYRIDVVKGGE